MSSGVAIFLLKNRSVSRQSRCKDPLIHVVKVNALVTRSIT